MSTHRRAFTGSILAALAAAPVTAADNRYDYRLLATSKTSTMEKEMNEAAAAGFVFADAMGGSTSMGGSEVVVVMIKNLTEADSKRVYKLLATSKTATMQKELQLLGDEGFDYRGQTVFESSFGGREVAVILELDKSKPARKIVYKLLATNKTSTMQKELKEAGNEGFVLQGTTVSKTTFGGSEIVSILKKQ